MAMLSEADLSDDDGEGDEDKDKDKGSDDGSGSDAEGGAAKSSKDADASSAASPAPALSAAEEAVLAAVESPASGKAWVELYCTARQRCYYVNRRSREVTWECPAGDAYLNDCDQYERLWQLHWDGEAKVASYSRVADTNGSSRRDHWAAASPGDAPPAGTRPDGTPEGYDGPLVVDYWEEFETEVEDTGAGASAEGGDGGDGASSTPKAMRKYYVNSLTEVTQWDKPEGWPRRTPEVPPPPLPVRPPPKPAAVPVPVAEKTASVSKEGAPSSPAAGTAAAAGSSPVSSPAAPAAGGDAAAGGARKRRGTSALGSGPGSGVGGVGSAAAAKAGASALTKVSAAAASLTASGFGAGGRPPSPPLLDPEAEATMEEYLGDADVEVFFNEEGGDAGANDDT